MEIKMEDFTVDFNKKMGTWFVVFSNGMCHNDFATAAIAINDGYEHSDQEVTYEGVLTRLEDTKGCKVVL